MGSFFIKGAIQNQLIIDTIEKNKLNHNMGAYQFFFGQIRADIIQNKKVIMIDYSCHQEMAENILEKIQTDSIQQYDLLSVCIGHSIGQVKVGEISLFVMVSAKHRKNVQKGIEYIVERIKKEVPIFGKEILEDRSHVWKENS